jgi:Lactonase, 7-bladed beta-propeller
MIAALVRGEPHHARIAIVWALDELDSTIVTYRFDPESDALTVLQVISTRQAGSPAAASRPRSRSRRTAVWVYGSNRGHDGIALLGANPREGMLKILSWRPPAVPHLSVRQTNRATRWSRSGSTTTSAGRRRPGKRSRTGIRLRSCSPGSNGARELSGRDGVLTA